MGCRALLFSGPSLTTTKKHNTKDISHPPWHLSSPLMTTHFIPILNIPILNILIKKSNHQKFQEHVPSEWDVGHFYFLGTSSQQQKTQLPKTNNILLPPWQLPLLHMTTFFILILNILIKKSNHLKIQEHAPSEWYVIGLGKHLQCYSIVPPPTHHALRLTCITSDAIIA